MRRRAAEALLGVVVPATVAALLLARGGTGAEPAGLPADAFRAEVREVLRDEDALVIEVLIETRPGAWVELASDKPDGGGVGSRAAAAAKGADGPVRTRLLIFADRVKAGSADTYKLLLKLGGESGGAAMSNVGPMPERKRLADVLSVAIKSGLHRGPVPALSSQGATFRISVKG